jgi:hypothetical protein
MNRWDRLLDLLYVWSLILLGWTLMWLLMGMPLAFR